jgi:hypothetical protein
MGIWFSVLPKLYGSNVPCTFYRQYLFIDGRSLVFVTKNLAMGSQNLLTSFMRVGNPKIYRQKDSNNGEGPSRSGGVIY